MIWGEALMGAELGTKVIGGLTGRKKGKKSSSGAAPIHNVAAKTPGFDMATGIGAGHVKTTLTPTAETLQTQEGLLSTLNQVRDAKGLVKPGFGALTQAVVKAIADAKSVAGGNLRESLARRRVAGASFGMDAETRLNAEFAKLEGEARSQSFLAEFATTMDLINTEHTMLRQQLDSSIQLLGLATGQSAGLTELATKSMQFERTLAAEEAAAAGQFAGQFWGDLAGIFRNMGGTSSGGSAGTMTSAGSTIRTAGSFGH